MSERRGEGEKKHESFGSYGFHGTESKRGEKQSQLRQGCESGVLGGKRKKKEFLENNEAQKAR